MDGAILRMVGSECGGVFVIWGEVLEIIEVVIEWFTLERCGVICIYIYIYSIY